jgi:hypothetical protein
LLNLSFLTNNTDTLVKERIEVINRKKGDRIAIIGGPLDQKIGQIRKIKARPSIKNVITRRGVAYHLSIKQ